MEKKLEAELNTRSQSTHVLASRIQLLIQINNKLNNENPLLQTYCRQLEEEYENLYRENERLLTEISKVWFTLKTPKTLSFFYYFLSYKRISFQAIK